MNVTSVAGSTSGSTAITVEPTLASGNGYKYKIAVNPTMPLVGAVCSTGYKSWDGHADIQASEGKKIVVVEVDANNRCVGAGMADVAVST